MTRRLLATLSLAMLATGVSVAQQAPAQPSAGLPALPAPRGSLSVSAATAEAVKSGLKPPPGFTVTAFAGPPVANYPTCITATHDGVVFVCVDRNGSLQADPGMGYVARLVDRNGDGQADEYSVFAALDSPRGAVFDGQTLYVSHPPFVTALRDTDNDGIADDRRTLVRGLGFGLDFRGADHTTNGIEMGIDGWLYVAVGDYGAVKAVGADGAEIQMRGGGNVRVRPDGTDLEIYSRGTRNDYDVAIDPYLNLFARGNTNDGGGFDIRLYHFVAGANFGYPTLFRNFNDEVVPPLADYGTGSGTGMLYVYDAALPAPHNDALYSVDWGRNAIYRHTLTASGATFKVDQAEFLTVPRPNDITVDGTSRFYVASWAGGQFRYAGEQVGYVARLTADGAKPSVAPDLGALTDARLADLIAAPNLVQSRAAQSAFIRRGRTPERVSLLERLATATTGSRTGRVAAIFALKQLAGSDATPALVRLAADPAMRAFALRALADRRGELSNVPQAPFVQALNDADPRVKLEAITGLRRMGATSAASAILPLTASPDAVIANVAVNALVALAAIDAPIAALARESDAVATGALRVLQQIHQPAVVSGLITALAEAGASPRRSAILQALARLHYREGVWRGTIGEWWGTRPDTTGPYYDPAAWEESARIRAVLLNALLQAAAGTGPQTDIARFTADLQRNRVLPTGGGALLAALAADRHAAFSDVARAIVGRTRLDIDTATGPVLDRVARANVRYRAAVVGMVVAAGPPTPAAVTILQQASADTALAADVRASAFTALSSVTGPDALRRAIDAYAVLADATREPPLQAVWNQFITVPSHATNIAAFREAAASGDQARQRLAYTVLLQLAADPPPAAARGGGAGGRGGGGGGRGRGGISEGALEAARTEARAIIDSAWDGSTAPNLVWAVGRSGAVRYRDRIETLTSSSVPQVRTAALDARTRLATLATPATPPAAAGAAAGPVVSSIPYETLVSRLAGVTGDVAVGQRLFTQQACAGCHTVTPAEPEKGPYLGGITTRYSRAELLESILRPNAKVAQGFATTLFTTTDNRQITGFVVREAQDDVVIRDLTGTQTTLRKAQVANRAVSEGSVMPPGLVDTLTLQELASLLAFLESTSAK